MAKKTVKGRASTPKKPAFSYVIWADGKSFFFRLPGSIPEVGREISTITSELELSPKTLDQILNALREAVRVQRPKRAAQKGRSAALKDLLPKGKKKK